MALILVADDDPEILKLIKQELEASGYNVVTATNGQTVIRIAQTQNPALIVLDVAMPMTTGIKAFESLRANAKTLKIPVIFLSGLPSSDVYPAVEKGTRVAHLKKPVDIVELISMIEKFLRDYPTSNSTPP